MTHVEYEGGEIARYVFFFPAMTVIFINRMNHQRNILSFIFTYFFYHIHKLIVKHKLIHEITVDVHQYDILKKQQIVFHGNVSLTSP